MEHTKCCERIAHNPADRRLHFRVKHGGNTMAKLNKMQQFLIFLSDTKNTVLAKLGQRLNAELFTSEVLFDKHGRSWSTLLKPLNRRRNISLASNQRNASARTPINRFQN